MADYAYLQSCSGLQPPCSSSAVDAIEADLKYRFPREYREFLETADGGLLTDTVILFSAGKGIDPSETLRTANHDRPGLPLVLVGRFADEEFGFSRNDASDPARSVYVYEHETGEVRKVADSFEGLVRSAMRGDRF